MADKNKIFVISAADRYNFGDLIFNYIIQDSLSSEIKSKYQIIYTSLLGNDLSKYQGHKTTGIRKVLKTLVDGDILLFAGGGLLGHKWEPMFAQTRRNVFFKYFKKLFSREFNEFFLRSVVFRTRNRYPYTISAKHLKINIAIIYNSVGGGALDVMKDELNEIRNILLTSSYISVRDRNVQEILSLNNIVLSPDSAILLSKIYSKSELFNKASREIQNILLDDYVILHFNKAIASSYKNEINDFINWLKEKIRKKIILLPVNYINNNDIKGQRLFRENMNCYVINRKLRLFEICAIIAHAQFVIGTSLHVNIIACSYEIPHLGMTNKIDKLNSFYQTWYNDSQVFGCYEFNDLKKNVLLAFSNRNEVVKVSNTLKEKTEKNFDRINSIISQYK